MRDDHVQFVARTLQRAGVPQSDLDDEIQRTFIIASRRLDDVQFGAERAFLFQVAINVAAHARRSLARRREVSSDQLPEQVEVRATPEQLIDRMQMRQLIDDILDDLDEPLRSVFTLFELEEMNMSDIAKVLGVPRGTVASRLRRAREQLRKNGAAIELASSLGAEVAAQPMDDRESMWRKKRSVLERALLGAGACLAASGAIRNRTLSVLGLAGSARI